MREEFLWVEKYRPKTIDECILAEGLKKTFQEFVDNKEIPNLLLTGLQLPEHYVRKLDVLI
jgi:hypothetical protein